MNSTTAKWFKIWIASIIGFVCGASIMTWLELHSFKYFHEDKRQTQTQEILLSLNPVGLSWDDPTLIEHLKAIILPPSPRNIPYKLADRSRIDFSEERKSVRIKQIFNGTRDLFFIEAGAADGEFFSNTLYFELMYGWTGLLIEPDPILFNKMLAKNRRAWSINAAISVNGTHVTEAVLNMAPNPQNNPGQGHLGLKQSISTEVRENAIKVYCYPLSSILKAIGVSRVDFFSLDVEYIDLQILKSLDLKNIQYNVIMVEFDLTEGREKLFKDYMTSQGYNFWGIVRNDAVFTKPGIHY